MADFYRKYGSKGAKLIAQYRVNKTNIMLHKVSEHHFVISNNRHILTDAHNSNVAIHRFNNAVAFEASDLFNS